MSFRVEVVADSSNTWTGNALRFAEKWDAEEYAADLSFRWTAVRRWRVVESADPVNAFWADGKANALPKVGTMQ